MAFPRCFPKKNLLGLLIIVSCFLRQSLWTWCPGNLGTPELKWFSCLSLLSHQVHRFVLLQPPPACFCCHHLRCFYWCGAFQWPAPGCVLLLPVGHRQVISAIFFFYENVLIFLFPVIDSVFMTSLSGAIAAFSRLPLLLSCGLCLGIECPLELMV